MFVNMEDCSVYLFCKSSYHHAFSGIYLFIYFLYIFENHFLMFMLHVKLFRCVGVEKRIFVH